MKRREFITLLGGAAAAWPLGARAQENSRAYRLGILLPSARSSTAVEAFFDELRLNGLVEGKNLVVIPGGFGVSSCSSSSLPPSPPAEKASAREDQPRAFQASTAWRAA